MSAKQKTTSSKENWQVKRARYSWHLRPPFDKEFDSSHWWKLDALNRIVTVYLEFAELQAQGRRVMNMRNWISKLDDFLRLSDREILTHAGKISHETAVAKAGLEFSKFRALEDTKPSPVEKHFDDAVKKLKQLKPAKGKKKP